VICRCGKLVQEVLAAKGAFEVLRRIMMKDEGEIRQWATHGMLALCVKEHARYQTELMKKEFKVIQSLILLRCSDSSVSENYSKLSRRHLKKIGQIGLVMKLMSLRP
jgi:hypothetical protein